MSTLTIRLIYLLLAGFLFLPSGAQDKGYTLANEIYEFRLEPGPDDLFAGAAFRIWIPGDVKRLRGVIVHQHGCGRNGMLMVWDHHWRALARKWDCALMGTHFRQADSCASWYNPHNGSERAFLAALENLAEQSGHPELGTLPWALWGHSGGAFWVSRMLQLHPERIIAVVARSGGFHITNPAAFHVPVLYNYGKTERPRLNGLTYYPRGRRNNAPWLLAPDPVTGHECGNSRLLAIPFFDVCLGLRLPENAPGVLRPVNQQNAWLGNPGSFEIARRATYPGDPMDMVWLPDGNFAGIWQEYMRTGWVTDTTPPAAPFNLSHEFKGSRTIRITWDAEADLQSGIKQFHLYRNGAKIREYTGINDDYVKKEFPVWQLRR